MCTAIFTVKRLIAIFTATDSSLQRWYFSIIVSPNVKIHCFSITWLQITFDCNEFVFIATFSRNQILNFRKFFKSFEGSWKMCVEVGSASIIFRYLTSRLNIWTRKINLNGEFQCYFLASYLNFLVFLNF